METTTPLQNATILRYEEHPFTVGVPSTGCWNCGRGLRYVVVVQDGQGQEQTIGFRCAERVGLDAKSLKEFMRERAQQEAYEAQRIYAAKRQAKKAVIADSSDTDHGSLSKFYSGCHCLLCVETAMATGEYRIYTEKRVVVSVKTGQIVKAKLVDGVYGTSWCVEDGAVWLRPRAKRRQTQASKGYVEARVPMLVKDSRRDGLNYVKDICSLGLPIVDVYGEPIVRAAL